MKITALPAPYSHSDAEQGAHLILWAPPYSLVWTGDVNDPIEACHGGHGEPVVALIDPRDPDGGIDGSVKPTVHEAFVALNAAALALDSWDGE